MDQVILHAGVGDNKLTNMIAEADVYRAKAVLDVFVSDSETGHEGKTKEELNGFAFSHGKDDFFAFRDMHDRFQYTVVDAKTLVQQPVVGSKAKPEDYNTFIATEVRVKSEQVSQLANLARQRIENQKSYRKSFDQIKGAYQRVAQLIDMPELKMSSYMGKLAQVGKIDVLIIERISDRMSTLADEVERTAEVYGSEALKAAVKLPEDYEKFTPEGGPLRQFSNSLQLAQLTLKHGMALNMYYDDGALQVKVVNKSNDPVYHISSEPLELHEEVTQDSITGPLDSEIDVTFKTSQITTDEPIAWQIPDGVPPIVQSLLEDLNDSFQGRVTAFIVDASITDEHDGDYPYESPLAVESHLKNLKDESYSPLDLHDAKELGASKLVTEFFIERSQHLTKLLAQAVNKTTENQSMVLTDSEYGM